MPLKHTALRILPLLLVVATLMPAPALAQSGLQIAVIEGQGAENSIETSIGAPVVVELRDAAGTPIPQAEVIFKSPNDGPSATFFGASHVSKAWTDENGRAQAAALTPNTIPGPYTIVVEATHQGASASAQIQQTNIAAAQPAKKKSRFGKKIWIPLALAAVIIIVGLAKSD